ncbi:MAG: VWA domain-containing protein [Verrucomicrobiaceae bacterium]|nr:VWA domain-containing protein [Verrucomicrobiaceae bacterium]
MTFLAPFYSWTFLALIPLLGGYFLKVRPRRVTTTALFLWMRIYEEKRRTAIFCRLRDLFSLLLIVDHSVSMSAGGRESSLDQAKAEDLIRGSRGNQRAAAITLASDLGFQTHLTDNPRALLDAIDRISPSTLPLRLEALKVLEKPIGGGSIHRVVFVTDGVTRDEDLPTGVEVVRVGETRGNVGIVAADMQLLPSREQGLGLYFQLASSFLLVSKA